jgi:hypothetical protein
MPYCGLAQALIFLGSTRFCIKAKMGGTSIRQKETAFMQVESRDE